MPVLCNFFHGYLSSEQGPSSPASSAENLHPTEYHSGSGQGMIRVQNRHRMSRRTFFGAIRPGVWIRVAVVSSALAGLLVARSGPLRLSALPSGHSAVTHLSHDQRPRFDNTGSQWSIPIASFVGTPPLAIQAGIILAKALDDPFRTEGAHYNRPPPCS